MTKAATRLYLPTALVSGGSVAIDAAQAHRLKNVLRLAPGAAVAGFNASDGEFLCRIVDLGRNEGTLTVETCLREAGREDGPWLVFAVIKRQRLEWLVEKGTELGVGAFVPVMTERTQPERLNHERLLAHAAAAAEQCERLSVPEVHPMTALPSVLGDWPADRRLLVCDETGGGAALADIVAGLSPRTAAAILIGPEGGFTARELDALDNLPFVTRAGLGPRVLRAETAALAALAIFQAIAGDGRAVRGRPRAD
jgi:16S rRNA (uracil1498-N3)-methyltransferase